MLKQNLSSNWIKILSGSIQDSLPFVPFNDSVTRTKSRGIICHSFSDTDVRNVVSETHRIWVCLGHIIRLITLAGSCWRKWSLTAALTGVKMRVACENGALQSLSGQLQCRAEHLEVLERRREGRCWRDLGSLTFQPHEDVESFFVH